MAEFSKKSSPVSPNFIDSNAWCRYLWLWWMSFSMLSGPPCTCLFSTAFVQVIMIRVMEARNMPFTKTHQKHTLSCQQWHEANTAELSCCVIGRGTQREGFSSLWSLMHFNAILYLIFGCVPACYENLLRAWLSTRPQDPTLVYFTAQTRYQSGCKCGPAQHQRCHGYMKRFTLTVTDTLPTNHCRLLNKSAPQRFQVFYNSGKIWFRF